MHLLKLQLQHQQTTLGRSSIDLSRDNSNEIVPLNVSAVSSDESSFFEYESGGVEYGPSTSLRVS